MVLQGGQGEGQRLGDGWKEVRKPTLQVMAGKIPGREDGGTGATKALAGSTPETLEGQSGSWCDGRWGEWSREWAGLHCVGPLGLAGALTFYLEGNGKAREVPEWRSHRIGS